MTNQIKVSFEFFPPRDEAAAPHLWPRIARLATVNPAFVTVTYGAGGLNGEGTKKTIDAATHVKALTGLPTGAHMTCLATTKETLHNMADELWARGIRHIVALRGDIPKDPSLRNKPDDHYYRYGAELVAALKLQHDFEISVGGYPEKHPQAPDLDTDILFLKQKVDAGADRVLTQFFFKNDKFFRFRDKAVAAGIDVPIIPGVLSIAGYDSMLRFANSCQAHVPDSVKARLEPFKDDPAALEAEASALLTEQCLALQREGASHIHFYTINHDGPVYNACKALGLGL